MHHRFYEVVRPLTRALAVFAPMCAIAQCVIHTQYTAQGTRILIHTFLRLFLFLSSVSSSDISNIGAYSMCLTTSALTPEHVQLYLSGVLAGEQTAMHV